VRTVELPAAPSSLSLDLDRTALIVVDMQNAFRVLVGARRGRDDAGGVAGDSEGHGF
jgi:isochorismate hydrolase